MSKVNNDKVDLNLISIKYCIDECPYPDECIATDQELCDFLKEKANQERQKYETEARERDRLALGKIKEILNEYGQKQMNDLAALTGFGPGYIQSLKRRGRLEFNKIGKGRRSRIYITGIINEY